MSEKRENIKNKLTMINAGLGPWLKKKKRERLIK